MIRFVHCADLHLDSPFKGVASDDPELAEILYRAPFAALAAAVDLAVAEQVDAFMIAGDAFDAAEQSLFSRLRFEEQIRRLDEAGIRSFYVCGNHDPLPAVRRLRLPESCHVFGPEVEKVILTRDGVPAAAVYGVSFPVADVRDNLALRFPVREPGLPAVAVLHCNIGGETGHQPYAPATVDDLLRAGMDYWALGHVHRRMAIREEAPAIVYPGCIQGTDIREAGPHGGVLVTLHDDGRCDLSWHEFDTVRYLAAGVEVTACAQVADVVDAVGDAARRLAAAADGRHTVQRLTLTGRPACGAGLRDAFRLEEAAAAVREQLASADPVIRVESLTAAVTPLYDLDRIRSGGDFRSELVTLVDRLLADPEALPEGLRRDWEQVFRAGRAAPFLVPPDPADTAEILRAALFLLLDQLQTGGDHAD